MGSQHLMGGTRNAHQILYTRVLEEKILVSLARTGATKGTLEWQRLLRATVSVFSFLI